MTPAEEGNFYTTRETMVTGQTATRERRAMLEAPSVASPLKPRRKNMGKYGRRERWTEGTRGLGAGEHETSEGISRSTTGRQHANRAGRASNHGATVTGITMESEATSAGGAAITKSGS